MFCPNCGKKVSDFDNFCKYCGRDLRDTQSENLSYNIPEPPKFNFSEASETTKVVEETPSRNIVFQQRVDKEESDTVYDIDEDEEIVVYELKKHAMALFWPCVFSPIFITYFWVFYVNIPTFWGFVVALIVLAPIVYPILRYFSDRSVITTESIHIRQGVIKVEDICIPLKKIHLVRLRRSFLGRFAEYGHLVIEKENSDKEITYRYIQDPDDVEFILHNPQAYITEYLGK